MGGGQAGEGSPRGKRDYRKHKVRKRRTNANTAPQRFHAVKKRRKTFREGTKLTST